MVFLDNALKFEPVKFAKHFKNDNLPWTRLISVRPTPYWNFFHWESERPTPHWNFIHWESERPAPH